MVKPWSKENVQPGALVSVGNSSRYQLSGFWRVDYWELEQGAIRLSLARHVPPTVSGNYVTEAGRAVSDADLKAGETRLVLPDLPSLDGQVALSPQLFVAAAGARSGTPFLFRDLAIWWLMKWEQRPTLPSWELLTDSYLLKIC